MKPIDLGSRRELFVDHYLIAATHGELERRIHSPTPREVVFPNDTDPVAHEDGHGVRAGHAYMTVLRDDAAYRMYYGVVRNYFSDRRQRWMHYAESSDGLHWQTPNLGLVEYNGSRDNNIIGDADIAPFIDANPGARPDERYKAILCKKGGADGQGPRALFAAVSEDGIRWRLSREEPVIGGFKFETQNLAFWDETRGEYRAYFRDFYPGPGGKRYRGILTATSPDFLSWSKAEWLTYPGAIAEELYTNQVIPYYRAPHLFIGLPTRYVERPFDDAVQALPETDRRRRIIERSDLERIGSATTDTLLMTSRDGVTFDLNGEAFIRPGLRPIDNWIYGDNYVNWGIVETASQFDGAPPELTFYSSEGSRRDHHSKVFRRYTLRIDGFGSLRGGRRGGEAITRPLRVTGGTVEVNFSGSAAGSLRVELQDRQGVAIEGFALDDCVPVLGDDLARQVAWRSDARLKSVVEQVGRIRFEVVDGDLYSFRFC